MPRYKLRTLLILLAVGPMVLAGAWRGWQVWSEYRYRQDQRLILTVGLFELLNLDV